MEAKEIFEANSRNVRELLSERGLGLYIPAYQRPYGWDKDKVAKLVADTLHGYKELLRSEESYTFLGTVITIHDINFTTVQPVVRPDVPGKVLTVIDGQQRLTTLLAFCVALHNQIRLAHAKLLKAKKPEARTHGDAWLDGQARRILDELQSTFIEKHTFGDSPIYPRMIRSFDDQWSRSKTNATYSSPIAHLIAKYAATLDEEKPSEFRPQKRDGSIEGEEALIDRFGQLSRLLKNVSNGNLGEEFDDLPDLQRIAGDSKFQRALLNHDFPDEVRADLLKEAASADFSRVLQLVLIACYALNRVALTVVRGKNEDYAFTIFESLNTTGEPLTAYETFKPRVVMAETLEQFEKSEAREHLNKVSDYLSSFKVGEPLQDATRELLISFASAETGYKLSKRLADQRKYLKEEFERYEADSAKRVGFVQHLRDVADFMRTAWTVRSPSLVGLPVQATTDAVKLCLGFLGALKHSVTIAPIVRFYSTARWSSEADQSARTQDLDDAIKALAAFSALWRASRRGTANIDQQYREILAGNSDDTTAMPALARSLRADVKNAAAPEVSVGKLKAELRARLAHPKHGGIADRDVFVREASAIPAYQNSRDVARFILLAAYHDAVADPANNGLIVKGKPAVSPCLTYEGFCDDRNFSLEHIAPQDAGAGWSAGLYEDREAIHRIGNLVLIPGLANQTLSSRPWVQKKVLYSALGAPSHVDAEKVLTDAKTNLGIEFGESTQEILNRSKYLPQVSALGARTEDWNPEFVQERSARILELAWDELFRWLE